MNSIELHFNNQCHFILLHTFLLAGGLLLAADYSQLELRILAHLSQDVKLIRILNADGDVFRQIAAQWKNVEERDVTDKQRQEAKQVKKDTTHNDNNNNEK